MDTDTDMLKTNPHAAMTDERALLACLSACDDCSRACLACADACLGEELVDELRRCIRINLDCADVCQCGVRLLTRQLEPDLELIRAQVELVARATQACAEECGRHAEMHAHCRICAETCRRCEQACQDLSQSLRAH